MTEHKHLKQLVRSRMQKTGESYSTARRQIVRQAADTPGSQRVPHHFPGSIPVAAALRSLLAHAGVRNPHTKAPYSEAMVFGLDGGIGAGMFAFHYPKERFSSFYIAGRHGWQDDANWSAGARKRLGVKAIVKESSGVKPGEKHLRELLEGGRPVMAWVDASHLAHRAMPESWSGGAYHMITIYGIDDATGTASIGDLADQPIPISLSELAQARGRIKKFKNRLLALEPAGKTPDLAELVRAGISACVDGLVKCKMKNFRLDAFKTWADKLDGSKAADSWEKIFPPGPLLYTGLWSVHEFIEHYGTGGGLCRPIFSDFLAESAVALKDPALDSLARRYAELGRDWSALAEAALPDSMPALREVKELFAHKWELMHTGGGRAEVADCWKALSERGAAMEENFPLDAAASKALRRDLKQRVTALYEGEVAALAELEGWSTRAEQAKRR
jgi:uncharacterized protein DUF4872/butirosin biosynthesis protein H-like